jgi:hypothetical protein
MFKLTAGETGAGEFGFYNTTNLRMLINASGNVGIGTNGPSAPLQINGAGGDSAPSLRIISAASNTFNWTTDARYANLTVGETAIHLIGKANSTYNQAYFGYRHVSDGSSSNMITLGMYAADYLVNITGLGNVGIGTTTPLSKLHVNGDIRASLANVSQANLVAYNSTTGLFTYLSTSSFAAVNIYNSDGTLTGDRLVDNSNFNLTFENVQDFVIDTLPNAETSEVVYYDSATGKLSYGGSPAGTPAGSTTQVQFNNAGAFGANAGFVYSGSRVGIGTTTPLYPLDVTGRARISDDLFLGDIMYHDNDTNTYFQFATDLIVMVAGGVELMRLSEATTDQVVINENSADVDFRVESDNNAQAFFVQGSDGNVGIRTSIPTGYFDTYVSNARYVRHIAPNGDLEILTDNGTTPAVSIKGTGTADLLNVFDDTTEVFTILDGGNVGIGITNPGAKLTVAGNVRINGNIDYSAQVGITQPASGTALNITNQSDADLTFFVTPSGAANKYALIQPSVGGQSLILNNQGGNVGIGLTNPNVKLHVLGPALTVNNENTYGLWVSETGDDTKAVILGYDQGIDAGIITAVDKATSWKDLILQPNGSRVGIGTNIPAAILHVSGGDAILRNAYIGEVPTYTAANTQFSHISRAGVGEYSFLSANDGETFINAKTGYNINFRINNSNVAIITSGGNVGIGTVTPAARLDVRTAASTTAPTIFATSGTGAGEYGMIASGDQYHGLILRGVPAAATTYEVTAGDQMSFFEYGGIFNFYKKDNIGPTLNLFASISSNSATYFNGGNVGIGTATPLSKLHVNGDVRASLSNVNQSNFVAYNASTGLFTYAATSSIVIGTATNADNVYINDDATDANQPVLFAELVNEYQPVRGNNNFNYNPATGTLTAGTYVETSALKFKENVIYLTGSLNSIEKLQGVSYNRIGQTRKEIGLIADEVVKVLPELVKYQDGEVYGLSYNRLTAVLVEAVKELSDKVKQQEIFIQDLADRLKKLEDKG